MNLSENFRNRMEQMLGKEEYHLFLSSYSRPRVQALRVNTLKITTDRFLSLFPEKVEQVPWCETGFYWDGSGTGGEDHSRNTESTENTGKTDNMENVKGTENVENIANRESEGDTENTEKPGCVSGFSGFRPGRHPWHEAGMYYIQEPSAMSVAALSGTKPGEKILDLCAAPGGKSTQLACMLEGRGLLISNEIDPERAKILAQNLERMGVRNAVVLNNKPAQLADRFAVYFDRVIVDAPCSGEGMFRKEEQAITMWSEENVLNCARRQQEILEEAARMVRSGGYLEYSTCTFAPEEDEGSVAAFLLRHPEFSLVDLPAQLGEKMNAYGFVPGNPAWGKEALQKSEMAAVREKEQPGGNNDLNSQLSEQFFSSDVERQEGSDQRIAEITEQLCRAVRLFPHKLKGEGHFVALLRREGREVPAAVLQRRRDEAFKRLDQGDHPAARQEVNQGAARGIKGNRPEKEKANRGKPGRKGHPADGQTETPKEFRDFENATFRTDLVNQLKEETGATLQRNGDVLFLAPTGLPLGGLRVLRQGLMLGALRKGRFEPAHTLAMVLHPEEVQQVLDLAGSNREAAAFLRGESLSCDPSLKGWVLVTVDGCSMGWGKASNGMLKNHYPKGLRRDVGSRM